MHCFQPSERDRWDQVNSVNGERHFPGRGKVPQPVGRTPLRPRWEQNFGRPAFVRFCRFKLCMTLKIIQGLTSKCQLTLYYSQIWWAHCIQMNQSNRHKIHLMDLHLDKIQHSLVKMEEAGWATFSILFACIAIIMAYNKHYFIFCCRVMSLS